MRGDYRHRVTLTGPGTGQTTNDEGETVPAPPVPLTPPTWWCSILPATARDLERTTAGATLTTATFILEGAYHAGITTQTRFTRDDGRVLYANGVQNVEERDRLTRVFASELVP